MINPTVHITRFHKSLIILLVKKKKKVHITLIEVKFGPTRQGEI